MINPVSIGKLNFIFKFCIACPAPPLIKLSIAERIIILFLYLDLHTDMRQLFVLITSFVLIKVSAFKILTKMIFFIKFSKFFNYF